MTVEPDQDPPRPFHEAAETGNIEVMKEMLEAGQDCNEIDWTGIVPLYWAVESGSIEAVRLLLESGADPNADGTSMKPWNNAAALNRVDMMRMLLKYGANPLSRDEDGLTALFNAAFYGNCEMFDMLIELGVSPHIIDNDGRTALDLAIEKNHEEIAAKLRAMGVE